MFVLYFPAFFLGILFAKYNVTDLVTTKIPLFIFPIAIALESILLYLFTSENYFSSYTISRIIGLCVVVTLFSYLKLNINRLQFINKDFYKSLDKNSMGIYLLHSIILLYFLEFDYVIQFMNNYELIAPFILLILSVGLSWAISILIRKTPLAFILG
jgi:surface polysaccharide O-acyltransferase-like enzyme